MTGLSPSPTRCPSSIDLNVAETVNGPNLVTNMHTVQDPEGWESDGGSCRRSLECSSADCNYNAYPSTEHYFWEDTLGR